MKPHLLLFFVASTYCLNAQSADGGSIDSVYTDLAGRSCKLVEVKEAGANSIQRCPGVAGFRPLVLDSDGRQSITIVTADDRKFDLNFWDVITRAFSSLGRKAEWRVARDGAKIRLLALIVRVNASEGVNSSQIVSHLAVTKITTDHICVVANIAGSPTAELEARRVADMAAEKACLNSLD
jgi:hypothetical protein